MSRELRLDIPATSVSSFLQTDSMTASNFTTEATLGLEAFKAAFQYVNGPENEEALGKAAAKHISAFDAEMPGLVALNEVDANKHLLDQWKVKLGSWVCSLQVNLILNLTEVKSLMMTTYLGPRNLG